VLSRPSSLLRPLPTPSRPPATSRALVIGGPASRAPPWPRSRGGKCDDAAGFASCCGPLGCSTPLRTRPLGHGRGLPYRGPWPLPGPDSHRLAAVSLSLGYADFPLLSLWRPNCWTREGRTSSDSRPDQAIPKHRPDRRPALWSEITLVSFSPDNVDETSVSPGGQSGSPIMAAEAGRSRELEERPGLGPDPRLLCPTAPASAATSPAPAFSASATPAPGPLSAPASKSRCRRTCRRAVGRHIGATSWLQRAGSFHRSAGKRSWSAPRPCC